MRTLGLLIVALSMPFIFAQGTLRFETNLDGQHAVPPSGSLNVGSGFFDLQADNRFTGGVFLVDSSFSSRVLLVQIFESADSGSLGVRRFDFTPGPEEVPNPPSLGGQFFELDVQLSALERDSVLNGNWYVNVTTPNFPVSEIRGQIVVVPEPNAVALAAMGILAVYGFRRLKR